MSGNQFEDRQKKARRESIKRRLKSRFPKIIRFLLFGAVVVTLFFILTETSIFNVKEVEVTGVASKSLLFADAKEIESLLEDNYIGVNFFTLDPEDIRIDIINQFPFVKNDLVEKVFPVGLLVTVEERIPYMTVQYGEECYLIDRDDTLIFDLDEFESAEEVVDCNTLREEYFTFMVTVSKDDYDAIFTDSIGFILFEQIYQVHEMLLGSGFTPVSYMVLERELQIRDEQGRTLIFDPFGEFDDQMKRFVLIFNQGSGVDDFRVIDFRYERPVLRE